jgi:predicted Zn-dependent peptidase
MKLTLLAAALVLAVLSAAPAPAAPAVDAPAAQVPVESFELENGMRFLLVHRPQLATVAAGWVAHVGSANERPGITGLAHFFEHMMFKGTHTVGTKDAERDLDVVRRQEEIQERIRAEYAEQRRRWRLGEIDDPYAAEARSSGLIDLTRQFDTLVEEQRGLMIKDELDQIYTESGASFLNATTNTDVTVYMITVPANKLELWFWLESDRLLRPIFREFYSERDVVYEERRLRTESTPTGKFDELFDAMFWQAHPYGWPTVGWASDLRVISLEQAQEFFDTYYAPNNITAVLVGNFDVEQVKELATRYFARIPRGAKEPPDVVTLEPEQLAEKRMSGECDCQPQIQVRYHTVPFGHRDSYALDVLGGVLEGRTGRLYKAMVEGKQIASSVYAGQQSQKYAGSFFFGGETKGDAAPADLEAGWDEVLAELQSTPVPPEELQKVKNVVTADTYRRLEDPFFLMIQLAFYDGMGDWSYLNTLAERTAAVTAQDVQRVANQYFARENRLAGHYTRKAGTVAEELPPAISALPDQMRQAVIAQLRQIRESEDIEALRGGLAQLEQQVGQVPPDMKGALEAMRDAVARRIAELEKDGEQSESSDSSENSEEKP